MQQLKGDPRTNVGVWLAMQGYNRHELPRTGMWYTPDGRQFEGKLDQRTIALYRSKKYVLTKKYTHFIAWYALEYGGREWAIMENRPEFDGVEEDTKSPSVPRLATALLDFMEGQDSWEGTATLLLSYLPSGWGLPRSPVKLSAEIIQPKITDVLKEHGIELLRTRNYKQRTLCLTRHTSW